MDKKIQLLAPAGDMERLEMAVAYGADAVYLAGKQYGMRSAAVNFDEAAMKEAVKFCHDRGKEVHVTCNTLPREDELTSLPEYLESLDAAGVDALIIADIGVLALAKKYAPHPQKHISTQFGVLNSACASALYDLGATTVVLARETPMEDIIKIRKSVPDDLRLEAFVHGAMCVSFSGRCLLSNYMTGRDANRGQCAQPCRWKYHLVEEKRPGEYFEISEDNGTFIMNSRDMCMIEHIPELINAGVNTFKIEGRMKSAYYTAMVTNAYRHAIDSAISGEPLDRIWINETEMVSHRLYSTGFYFGTPGQNYSETSYTVGADIAAVVDSCDDAGNAVLFQRNKFYRGDELELVAPNVKPVKFVADHIFDSDNNEIEDTRHAMMELHIKLPVKVSKYAILRKCR